MAEEKKLLEYYQKTRIESNKAIADALPTIVMDVSAAVLVWLFASLVFIPISEGINFYGYPLTRILNFVVLVALAVILLKILRDVRSMIDGVAGFLACEIGAPYDVSQEEVEHYQTAMRGIFRVIVVSLAYLLFVDFLSGIHPALSGVTLLVVVIWAIYEIWRVVQAISSEIRRYTTQWSQKLLSRT